MAVEVCMEQRIPGVVEQWQVSRPSKTDNV